MPDNGVLSAILGGDISLAGLVLVFSGFLFGKANEFSGRYGDRFKWLAVAGVVPALGALAAAWACADAIQGNQWAAAHAFCVLKVVLVLTGLYAIVAGIAFFP